MIVKNTKDNAVKTIEIPDGAPMSFYNQELIFEEGIERIEIENYGYFRGHIHIPSTVLYINYKALQKSYISNIVVSENNTQYADYNGILLTKDLETLYCVPKHYAPAILEIPESVNYVMPEAFYKNNCITHLAFKGNVRLSRRAFENAKITDLTFEKNVYTPPYSFVNCKNLTRVNIGGEEITLQRNTFVCCDALFEIKTPAGDFMIPYAEDTELLIANGTLI